MHGQNNVHVAVASWDHVDLVIQRLAVQIMATAIWTKVHACSQKPTPLSLTELLSGVRQADGWCQRRSPHEVAAQALGQTPLAPPMGSFHKQIIIWKLLMTMVRYITMTSTSSWTLSNHAKTSMFGLAMRTMVHTARLYPYRTIDVHS